MTKSNLKNTYTYAVGRRRLAVATVKLFLGKVESTVNGIALKKYFPGNHDQIILKQPFVVTNNDGKYYFQAKTTGGGKTGQLNALVLALSRAFKKINEDVNRSLLRKAGLLTVDSRIRQRRHVGTGGKSRRQKQSPKR